MAKGFFNPENKGWSLFSYVCDILLLSLAWVLCSLPVLTVGAASAALYDSTVHGIRRGEHEIYARYKRTFLAELKNSIPSTLLWGAVIAAVVLVCRALGAFAPEGRASLLLEGVGLCVLALAAGLTLWAFALPSRFDMRFSMLHGNALRLGLAHALRTVAAGAAALASAFITARLVAPVMFLPGLTALWCSYMFEPVMAKYE